MKAKELALELLKTPNCEVQIRYFEHNKDGFGGTPKQAVITGVWQFSESEGWLDLNIQERHNP